MADEFYTSLKFQGGFVNGILGGKLLNCLVNPSLPGSAPAAGVYQIQAPVQDAVFGLLAVMTPVGKPDGGGALGGTQAYKPWGDLTSRSASAAYEWGASAALFDKLVGARGGSTSFVLSSRPIPGRNCLVIQSGFADLMDALKTTGGATVRF